MCVCVFVQVMKERMRVLEFMRDYDKLRSGRIPATSFRRALDLCGFGLGQDEVASLEKMSVCRVCVYVCVCVRAYVRPCVCMLLCQ